MADAAILDTQDARLAGQHIVDALIAERAPKLAAQPVWPLLRPALYALLGYGKARAMADAVAPMSGQAAMDYVTRLLDVKVEVTGLERIAPTGRLVLVCNHPTGIADGIAVYEAIRPARPDLIFFANADALRVAPRLDEVLVPVEWVEEKRTREKTRDTLIRARAAFEAERAVVIFPAGRLARRAPDGSLDDPPWQPSALSLARKYDAPVVPMYLEGPWSHLFHFFDRFSQELRDITLFHELLNKRGRTFRLTIGHPIAPDALDIDATRASEAVKAYIARDLATDPDKAFT
jgi:putative hemolysin